MDWRCGSSSRAPVLQAQSPEFKPTKKKKKKRTKKGQPLHSRTHLSPTHSSNSTSFAIGNSSLLQSDLVVISGQYSKDGQILTLLFIGRLSQENLPSWQWPSIILPPSLHCPVWLEGWSPQLLIRGTAILQVGLMREWEKPWLMNQKNLVQPWKVNTSPETWGKS
jgi:hypothetical protein